MTLMKLMLLETLKNYFVPFDGRHILAQFEGHCMAFFWSLSFLVGNSRSFFFLVRVLTSTLGSILN